MISNALESVSQVTQRIEAGQYLMLAGDEKQLSQLPKGNWFGGTIPYFMSDQGGLTSRELIHVTQIPDSWPTPKIQTYSLENISNIYQDIPESGFGLVTITALTEVHKSFGLKAHTYSGFASLPLIGWIAGIHLEDLNLASSKVFNGTDKSIHEDAAVAMHVTLPAGKHAEINIVNIFQQGDGDTIRFFEDGFAFSEVEINGNKQNFAAYLKEKEIDTRLPLVFDSAGAAINVSFQQVDHEAGNVTLYAPVFAGVDYKIAAPVGAYVDQFQQLMHNNQPQGELAFSCNCILNYLYGELEGKQTKPFTGPITFGEVAYRLVNQTLAYLSIHD
jgi:hypothetical protein